MEASRHPPPSCRHAARAIPGPKEFAVDRHHASQMSPQAARLLCALGILPQDEAGHQLRKLLTDDGKRFALYGY